MKPLTLSKSFPYLLNFPSTNSNLVTYLALYTKLHTKRGTPSIPLSLPYSETSFILLPHTHFYTFPSLLQNLFAQITTQHTYYNTPLSIIHYPSFPHSIIMKYHHFAAHKHISISFSISLAIPHFLENNITNVITRKTTPAAAFTTFNLHIIYLILPYILQIHSS